MTLPIHPLSVTIRVERKNLMTIKQEWEINQLVKAGIYSDADAVLRSALEALFVVHPDHKMRMIAAAYGAGDISLGKVAELLGVSSAEAEDLLRQAGVQLHLGPESVDELNKEISTVEST
jgi:predicted HTH domain antitoxin